MTIAGGRRESELGVIRFDLKGREKQGLAARFLTPAVRLHCHEDRINVLKRARVFELEYPALLGSSVLIKDAKAKRLLLVCPTPAPSLERTGIPHAWLLIQVIGIKDEGFPFRMEHTAVRFLRRSIPSHVVDLSNIQIARAHQIPDVAVVGQQFVLFANSLFLVAKLTMKIPNLGL